MEILQKTFLLYRRNFLQLIAIYLVGWLVRYGIVQVAINVAVQHGMLWGDFIMPLAVLTMLLTYLGMFWVMRPMIEPDATDRGLRAFLAMAVKITLPAFAIFALWKLHLHDMPYYVTESGIRIVLEHKSDVLDSSDVRHQKTAAIAQLADPDPTILLAIVVFLLGIRRLLTLAAERLPTWTIPARLYVEATWLYLFFVASGAAIFGSPQWISERKAVVWYRHQKQEVLEHLGPVAQVTQWVNEHTAGTAKAILAPLSWFVIAGLAYGHNNTSTWMNATRSVLGASRSEKVLRAARKPAVRALSGWRKLPNLVRSRTEEIRSGILGSFDHARHSIRLALQTGPLPLGIYILLFALVVLLYPTDTYFDTTVSDGIAWRGVAHLLGPHEYDWWKARETTIRLLIAIVVEPIRLCLVGGMYWYCISRLDQPVENRTIRGESSSL